jgi:CheY-like chemotaxis protein
MPQDIPSLRILIVEDEMMIALSMEEMVTYFGHTVVGPALTLEKAMQLVETAEFDCAILDVNLGHKSDSTPIAQALTARGIPFLFATGYGAEGVVDAFSAAPILKKPFPSAELRRVLRQIVPPPDGA